MLTYISLLFGSLAAWVAYCIVRRPASTKYIHRPPLRAILNAVFTPLSALHLGPQLRPLKADDLIAAAKKEVKVDDFGPNPGWRRRLDILLSKLNKDSTIDTAGYFIIRGKMVSALASRLELEDAYKSLPAERKGGLLPPIVMITGFPRTGTTLMHHLIDKDPRTRGTLFPEVLRPGASKQKQIELATTALKMENLFCPMFEGIHKREMTEPDECFAIFDFDFSDPLYMCMANDSLENMLAWEDSPDMSLMETYSGVYQRTLKVLWDRYEKEDGSLERLLVKCPFHQRAFGDLAKALPPGQKLYLIHPHRNLNKAIGSVASLFTVYAGVFGNNPDPKKIGQFTVEFLRRSWEKFRKWELEESANYSNIEIVHIRFEHFVKNPKGVIRGIYNNFGFEWADGFDDAMDKYLEKSRKAREHIALHTYSLEDFGLNEDQLNDTFKEYQQFIDSIPDITAA